MDFSLDVFADDEIEFFPEVRRNGIPVRNDGAFERLSAGACPPDAGKSLRHVHDDPLCECDVCSEIFHDHIDRDEFIVRMPGIVIRHHCNGTVTDFRLPRQLRLSEIGHADHIESEQMLDAGFRRR